MPWKFSRFGDVLLPTFDPTTDLSPGEVESTLLLTAGGALDLYAGRTRLPSRVAHGMQGTYFGETTYWVTHLGSYMVDHDGTYIVSGLGPSILRRQVQALKRRLGQVDSLYRERLEDGLEQYKSARLLGVPHTLEKEDGAVVARVSARFESVQAGWRDASATSVAVTLAVGDRGLVAHNDGDIDIEDATLTIAASSSISGLRIISSQGMDLSFGATVAAGTNLVIDGGGQTVRKAGADAYGSITRNAGHTQASLLRLVLGDTVFSITTSAGAGTATVGYRNQWL